MIKYRADLFGLRTLTRWHGSAVFRALVPSLFSTGLLVVFIKFIPGYDDDVERRLVQQPYVIAAFIAFFSFLLTFRLNYSYQRYWEAATAVHQMTSKWLDAAICIAAFHYQSVQYENVRPPSFGQNPKIKNETRERERSHIQTLEEMETIVELSTERKGLFRRFKKRKPTPQNNKKQAKSINAVGKKAGDRISQPRKSLHADNEPKTDMRSVLRESRTSSQSFANTHLTGLETPIPALFLQEIAHLFSLLSAVAMSTLRGDIEGVQSPLDEYISGTPFPPVDPDDLKSDVNTQLFESSPFWTFLYFIMGTSRSPRHRTMYNAARPFKVLGGVSDSECEQLSRARGPYAKVALCIMWVQEFLSREYLAGSTGGVAPPIISRLYQFISDGVVGYNQSRKLAYIPFPFPHAQLTTLYVGVVLFIFPTLYYSFVNQPVFACILNFTTVLCFIGIHEVARELQNPFFTVPNDLPLNNFQAQFNEALITMYAGFHPDAWRKEEDLPPMTPVDEGEEEKQEDDGVKVYA